MVIVQAKTPRQSKRARLAHMVHMSDGSRRKLAEVDSQDALHTARATQEEIRGNPKTSLKETVIPMTGVERRAPAAEAVGISDIYQTAENYAYNEATAALDLIASNGRFRTGADFARYQKVRAAVEEAFKLCEPSTSASASASTSTS